MTSLVVQMQYEQSKAGLDSQYRVVETTAASNIETSAVVFFKEVGVCARACMRPRARVVLCVCARVCLCLCVCVCVCVVASVRVCVCGGGVAHCTCPRDGVGCRMLLLWVWVCFCVYFCVLSLPGRPRARTSPRL